MENKEKKMLTTEDLNRTLGKKELYSIAFGHVIGSGVFSLIGIGIGYTGKSAWIGLWLKYFRRIRKKRYGGCKGKGKRLPWWGTASTTLQP